MLNINIICKINVNKYIKWKGFYATCKIKSNTADVQEAVAEPIGLQVSNFQTIEMGTSIVTSMKNGLQVTNELMNDISKVVTCVLTQANMFPELAQCLEELDIEDAQRWK